MHRGVMTAGVVCAALTGWIVVGATGQADQSQQSQTQQGAQPQGTPGQQGRGGRGQTPPSPEELMIREMVSRLELERYKATIKGLTQFGDRREGTQRNRDAVNWIETQLKSYGCQTARMEYDPQNPEGLSQEEREKRAAARGGGGGRQGQAGGDQGRLDRRGGKESKNRCVS